MAVIPCNIGRFVSRAESGLLAFDPTRGSIVVHGRRPTLDDGPHAALIIVVGDDADRVVEAASGADATSRVIVTQRGHLTRGGETIFAIRVMLFQDRYEHADDFTDRAVRSAQRIRDAVSVTEVVVEIQNRGIHREALGIVA